MKSNKKNSSQPKNNHRKNRQKLTLNFNEEKRKNFLGGFHKRKLERKKRAQEELRHQLKLEKKKIKKDAQEKYKKMLSFRRVPELEEFNKEEYEMDGRQVSILELDIADLMKRTESIGANAVSYEDESSTQQASDGSRDKKGSKLAKSNTGSDLTNIKMNGKQKPKKIIQQAVKKSAMKIMQNSKAFRTQKILSRNKNKKDARRKKKFQEECKSKNKRHKK